MSKKFVRNITGTKLRGAVDSIEPYHTNLQNDLLSDEEDVFVRNNGEPSKNKYHALTDNIKTISVPSDNDVIEVKKTGKNSRMLIAKETKLNSLDERLKVIKKATNDFDLDLDLDLDLSNYYTKEQTNDTFKTNPLNEESLSSLSGNNTYIDFNDYIDSYVLRKNTIFTVQTGTLTNPNTPAEIDFSTLERGYYHIPLYIQDASNEDDDIIDITLKFHRSKTYPLTLKRFDTKLINIYIMDESVFIDDTLTEI